MCAFERAIRCFLYNIERILLVANIDKGDAVQLRLIFGE